jgi:ERCC4-type nuclease
MVIVDDRGGSAGLAGAKKRLNALRNRDVDADLGHLDFGDYAFAGNGPNGTAIMVGIELKTTRDLISSLRSNRLMGHQIPGMIEMYKEGRLWLITEGIWREGQNGQFECYLGSWQTFSAGSKTVQMTHIESWILSTIQLGGMSYWHCPLQTDTARFVDRLHHWWTAKEYEEHRSHEVVYRAPPDRALFATPSDFVGMVSVIPNVGWTRAFAIEKACQGSPLRPWEVLMNMSAKDLVQIEGVGMVIAKNILKTLHG